MKSIALALALCAISGAAQAVTLTNLAGDRDSFGTDKPDGSTVSVNEILASSTDPADVGGFDVWNPSSVTWSHVYDLTGFMITGAKLTVSTLDMEDNGEGDGDGGEFFDTTLFLNGTEIDGAFDSVFTGPADAATQITPNVTVFILDSFIGSLGIGSASFLLNPRAGPRADAISVDYAELELTLAPAVPLPAGLPLLLAGLGGFAFLRRRKS